MLQRKYVRESVDVPPTNFYAAFREWLEDNYPILNSDIWDKIMEEDSSIDYSNGFLDAASEEFIQNNSNSSDH